MYRGYIFSVILVILSLLGVTGFPSECFADLCSELFIREDSTGNLPREDFADNIRSEMVFTGQGKKYFPREGVADNTRSEVSTGSFYSIEEKLDIMSKSIKRRENDKLKKKLSNVEKRIEKLFTYYESNYKDFMSKKKELEDLEREYKSLKRQIEQNDKKI